MSHRVLCGLSVVVLLMAVCASVARGKQPNILFIFSDDHA